MFYRLVKDGGVEISIWVTPKASKNQIQGIHVDSKGHKYLKVTVTAVPEDNKANEAVLKLLVKRIGFSKSQVRIVRGHTFRVKVIAVDQLSDSQWEFLKGFRRSNAESCIDGSSNGHTNAHRNSPGQRDAKGSKPKKGTKSGTCAKGAANP